MSRVPSPLTLDLTNTRAFKTWLYQLWQSTGGSDTTATDIDEHLATLDADVDAIEAHLATLDADVDAIEAHYTKAKQSIIDLGADYVLDATINVIDAEITTNSIIECSIAPVANGYTRPIEEVIYERIMVYATPKNGSIDFYLQPERGHFKGEFVINYMVKV